MIVSMHVATGAAAGALVRRRGRAFALGAALHALGDRIPHRDIDSLRFEIWSGLGLVAALAVSRGPLDATVLGAIGASSPDLEHVLRLPHPGGRKLFPSHRIRGFHREGGISTGAQLLLAGALVGMLIRPRRG